MSVMKQAFAGLVAATVCLGATTGAHAISSSFVALLYGGNVVADTDGKADAGQRSGYGLVSINFPTSTRMCYSIYTVSIDRPLSAAIVSAPPGVNNTDLVRLKELPKSLGPGISSACVRVKKALADQIRSRPADHYVVVRTRKFRNGAIRGQLL